jgi:hypothetical protein
MTISKRITEHLINWVNTQEPSVTSSLLMGFDLLDTNKNSICISFPDGEYSGDVLNDVTGIFSSGFYDISIYFRDISGAEGMNDLLAYDLLNNLANYIKKNYTYKEINSELAEWVEKIEITSKAKMVKVYDGNIKDYEVRLRLHYVYKN